MAVDYQELIKERKYEEAAVELKKQLELLPDDVTRRRLAWCLFLSDQTADALSIAEVIDDPTPNDWILVARIQWQLGDWEGMSAAIKRAARQKPSAETYELLAIAETRGQGFDEIDDATNQIVRVYLTRATEFDDCPSRVYLMLIDTFSQTEFIEKANFLQKGKERFPTDSEITFELARLWIHKLHKNTDAIELLQPLLSNDQHQAKKARWHIFEAQVNLKNFAEASSLLEEIATDQGQEKQRVEVDFLFRQGKLKDWLVKSEEISYEDESEAMIRSCFRKAYANLHTGKTDQALENFLQGAKKLFDEPNVFVDTDIYFYSKDVQSYFYGSYGEFDVLTDVCESILLLAHEGHPISDKAMGLLAYTVKRHTSYNADRHDELASFFPQRPESLLLFADEKLEHPTNLALELAEHFLQRDLVIAIDHFLRHVVWSESGEPHFEKQIKDKLFSDVDEFTVGQDVLLRISEIALARARTCRDDQAVYEAFDSFYSSIWRKILFDTRQYQTVVEINKKFVDATDGEDGLFDLAYGLDALEKVDEAEEAYRRLLTKQSKNASAVNNLGVIYSRKGKLDEALACFTQAAELEPSTQLYAKNRDNISTKIKFKDVCAQKAKNSIDAIKQKAFAAGLTDEQLAEINALYWANEVSTKEIQEKFGLGSSLNSIIIPATTSHACPNCGVELRFRNRTDKSSEHFMCLGCGHENRSKCRCDFCQRQRQEQARQATEARQQQAVEDFKKLEQKYCKPEYVIRAISGLAQKEADFLRSVVLHSRGDKPFDWKDICAEIGVSSERPFVKKLVDLKLLLEHPDGTLVPNSAVEPELLINRIQSGGSQALSPEEQRAFNEAAYHWQRVFGLSVLSVKDEETIKKLVTRYSLNWIKEAATITAGKGIRYYANYASAILRNWDKDGPPEYLNESEQYSQSDQPKSDGSMNTIATLASQREGESGQVNIMELRAFLVRSFNREEFEILCYDLGLQYDDLRGESKEFCIA